MFPVGVGEQLGGNPFDPRVAASRNALFTLMRGSSFYGQAAGGFDRVQAMPQLQRFRGPASPHTDSNVQLVELYAQQPGLFRQRLERMFIPRPGPGR